MYFSGSCSESCSKAPVSSDVFASEAPNYGEYPQEAFFEDSYNGPWPSVLKQSGKPLLSAKFKRNYQFFLFI